jgi:type IV pilus assembly protein PilE
VNNFIAKQRGFTLIELMIVVAVIGVLAAIAYPSYERAIRKSRRHDGTSTLLDVARNQEIYRNTNASYTTNPALLGMSTESPEHYYHNLTISAGGCTNGIVSCYTVSIVPSAVRDQNKDTIQAFRLNSSGVKERLEYGSWESGWK